jgi:hypothetical protein
MYLFHIRYVKGMYLVVENLVCTGYVFYLKRYVLKTCYPGIFYFFLLKKTEKIPNFSLKYLLENLVYGKSSIHHDQEETMNFSKHP